MSIRTNLGVVAVGVAVLTGAGFQSGARAATVVFQDDFEQYAVNSYIQNLTPPVGAPWSSDTQGMAGNSTYYWRYPAAAANGGNLYLAPGSRTTGFLTSSAAAATQGKVVAFDFDFYIRNDGDTSPSDGLAVASFLTDGEGNFGARAFDILLEGQGTIAYYAGGASYTQVSSQDFSFPAYTWLHANILADYSTHQATLTVGTQSYVVPFADNTSNQVDRFTISATGGTFNFADNLAITIVPEPGSLGLLVTGGLLVLRRRNQ